MGTDQFEDWKTQAEAAEILQVSPRTIARLAAQQKLQRGLRRVPGRKPPASVPPWRHRGDPRRDGTGQAVPRERTARGNGPGSSAEPGRG